MYDKNGETFVGDYYFLGSKTYTNKNIFMEEQHNTDVFATFSMPFNSECQRGYLAYPIEKVQDGYIISSTFNYTHQISKLHYPAMNAMNYSMVGDSRDGSVFKTVQDIF